MGSTQRTRPATSFDVARRAGVSRSTVSNILNGNDDRFPEATRERVREAAAALDYQPSPAGRSLASGRSSTVVVLLPHTTFGSNLQNAVDEAVAGTTPIGGNVVVRFGGQTREATMAALTALRPLAVVDFGVLSEPERLQLEQREVIVVPSVRRDDVPLPDAGIAALQAEALLSGGPRRLWFAALEDERLDPYGPGRQSALRAFCSDRGLAEPHEIRVPLNVPGAVRALAAVLELGTPAGVACYNDDVAIALLAAARELGAVVPDQVALVGVDHTPVGQLWSPPLTTVDTDLPGLVAALTQDLRERLSGGVRGDSPMHTSYFSLVPGGTA